MLFRSQGTQNDTKKGVSQADALANKREMKKILQERGIRIVNALAIIHAVGRQPGMLQPDHIHLTAEAHRKVAAQLMSAIR